MTAVAAVWASLDTALRQRRPVRVSYHGLERLICPHALGWKHGRPIVLGYQTGGETSTGALPADPRKRWRCLFIDEIVNIVDADPPHAWHSADNYNRGHPFHAIDEITVAI